MKASKILDTFTKAALIATCLAGGVKGCFDYTRALSDYSASHHPDRVNHLTNG